MKRWLVILFFISGSALAQKKEVLDRMNRLHRLMESKDAAAAGFLHDSLSYGHSNGWIENKQEFQKNLGSYLVYHSIKEDSIRSAAGKKVAHVRFNADIDATLNGTRTTFRLKVLEVWVREKRMWKLFARQAVKR